MLWRAPTFNAQFPGTSYADGHAMVGYDAMLTSISAAHLAGPKPSPSAVANALNALHGRKYVQGASGPINLSADYMGRGAEGSNPMNKAIPILSLTPNGAFAFEKLEFSGG